MTRTNDAVSSEAEVFKASSDVAREANKSVFQDEDLKSITNLDDAFRVMQESGIVAESFADYGTGFEILDKDEKGQLIKKPFMIVEWRFTKSEYKKDTEFVSALVVTKDGGKYILNDGSTGIAQQLRNVTDSRLRQGKPNPQTGLLVEKGLRVSEYPNPAPDAAEGSMSRTYYLAN